VRTDPDDEATQPIPYETIAELAAEWRARQIARAEAEAQP